MNLNQIQSVYAPSIARYIWYGATVFIRRNGLKEKFWMNSIKNWQIQSALSFQDNVQFFNRNRFLYQHKTMCTRHIYRLLISNLYTSWGATVLHSQKLVKKVTGKVGGQWCKKYKRTLYCQTTLSLNTTVAHGTP